MTNIFILENKNKTNFYFKQNSYKKWRPIISENEIDSETSTNLLIVMILTNYKYHQQYYHHLAIESFLEFACTEHVHIPQGIKVLMSLILPNSGDRMTRG